MIKNKKKKEKVNEQKNVYKQKVLIIKRDWIYANLAIKNSETADVYLKK